MNRPGAIGLLAILPLYGALAAAIGFADYAVRPRVEIAYTQYTPQVVAGTAEAPGRYRVLAPYLFESFARVLPASRETAWALFRWLCLVAVLLAGHLYYATWFDTAAVVGANALTLALLPLTFTNAWPNPDQFTELALFTFACACIARGWTAAFAVALVVNAFNRETSVFLLPLFLLAGPLTAGRLRQTAAFSAVWVAIAAGLRWSLGYQPYDLWQASRNLHFLVPMDASRPPYYRLYGLFFLILIVPLALVIARTWRSQPRFMRAAAGAAAPALFVVGFLFSSTIESRIFTPMLPLLGPGLAWALGARGGTARAAGSSL